MTLHCPQFIFVISPVYLNLYNIKEACYHLKDLSLAQ